MRRPDCDEPQPTAPLKLCVQEFDRYVMTVSSQAVASLAADAQLELSAAYARLQALLASLGMHYMADTATATAAALQFARDEFLSVFRRQNPAGGQRQAAAAQLASAVPAGTTVLLSQDTAACSLAEGWQVQCMAGEVAFISSGFSAGSAVPPAKKAPRTGGGRPAWRPPPVSLAISSTRTKIIPDGNIKSVNAADDGGPIVNLDGGASAPGVVVDSATGTAVDVDGSRVQLTGPQASDGARAQHIIQLCAAASVPLPGIPAHVAALPVLASACPGWVCYAEKTHPAALQHISRVKSPQALAGEMVKFSLGSASSSGVPAAAGSGRVYHCTLMPCFDKKLEASRRDMYSETGGADGVKLVDCVITPEEVGALLQERGFASLAEVPLPSGGVEGGSLQPLEWAGGESGGAVVEGDAAGSGGYAAAILRGACAELLGVQLEGALPWQEGRNTDLRSVAVTVDGTTVLSVATAYGFRNIQTVMTRMKTGRCTWDYVEAMACGGGCPNGGGQLRVRPSTAQDGTEEKATPAQQRARVSEVTALLASRAQLAPAAAAAAVAAARGRERTGYHALPTAGTSGAVAW